MILGEGDLEDRFERNVRPSSRNSVAISLTPPYVDEDSWPSAEGNLIIGWLVDAFPVEFEVDTVSY